MDGKNRTLLVMVAGFFIVFLVVSGGLTPQSLLGIGKEVQCQTGYDTPTGMWVLTSTVNEKEDFRMVLHEGTAASTGSGNSEVTQTDGELLFAPQPPLAEKTLYKSALEYVASRPIVGDMLRSPVPAWDLGTEWLVTARYSMLWMKNAVPTGDPKQVSVNYKEPHYISVDTGQGVINVQNQGIIFQGLVTPDVDMTVVFDPTATPIPGYSTAYRLWRTSELANMLEKWESSTFWTPGTWTWTDVVNWAKSNNYLPTDLTDTFEAVNTVSYKESNNVPQKINLNYGAFTWTALITVKIPAAMVDSIVVQTFAPKPKIVSVSPETLPAINEGSSTSFQVVVKNEGTEGTVYLSVVSQYYKFTSSDALNLNMQAGETKTFTITATALDVASTMTANDIKIFVEGSAGSETRMISGTINNVVDEGHGGGGFWDWLADLLGGGAGGGLNLSWLWIVLILLAVFIFLWFIRPFAVLGAKMR